MSEKTLISWADSTLNWWIGCEKVSPGCTNCYAESQDKMRFSRNLGGGTKDAPISHWGKGAPRYKVAGAVKSALAFNRKPWICDKCGDTGICDKSGKLTTGMCQHCGTTTFHRRRIFSLSLGDWLDDEVPIEWLAEMLDTIRQCDQVTWILCTKRPENFFSRLIDVDKFLSCSYPAHHENTIQRSVPLRRGEVGGTENRPSRAHLEIEKAVREKVAGRNPFNKVPDGAGGVVQRSVSSSQGDAKRSEEICSSGKVGVASLQRSNPAGVDGEPQGREKDKQPPKQSGIGNSETADTASLSKAGVQSDGSGRDKELGNAPDRSGRDSNTTAQSEGRIHSGITESILDKQERGMDDLHGKNLEASALRKWITRWLQCVPPENVIVLISVENQAMADKRIPELLKIPAACHGLSLEPLLSPVDLTQIESTAFPKLKGRPAIWDIDWVIIGCESGSKRRDCDGAWIENLVEQGKAAGVATFVKQVLVDGRVETDPAKFPPRLQIQNWPEGF